MKWFVAVLTVLALLVPSSIFAATNYTVTDLGTLGDGETSAYAINDLSQVVGVSNNKAFIWDTNNGIRRIAPVGYPDTSCAFNINNRGEVTGSFDDYIPIEIRYPPVCRHPFVWSEEDGFQIITTADGYGNTAYGINNLGQVVGQLQALNSPSSMAFRWDPVNGMEYIEQGYVAYSINDNGQIVGHASYDGSIRAYIWDPTNGFSFLGPIDGSSPQSYAYGINQSGQVAGSYQGGEWPYVYLHAFLWDELSGLVDLTPQSIYTTSWAHGINDSGYVVGQSRGLGGVPVGDRAFVWSSSDQAIDLNLLIDPLSGWTLIDATDINNKGQIVGKGKFNGQDRAFLLEPFTPVDPNVPEPSSLLALGGGLIGLVSIRRKRK